MMNTNKSVKLINLNTQTQLNPGKKIYNGSKCECAISGTQEECMLQSVC